MYIIFAFVDFASRYAGIAVLDPEQITRLKLNSTKLGFRSFKMKK